LWIAATVRAPDPSEVEAVEAQYREIYKGKFSVEVGMSAVRAFALCDCCNYHIAAGESFDFPDYPTSCLLGCVDLVDCLTQDEYQEKVCWMMPCVPLDFYACAASSAEVS
jgi:hypothetical protein